jgi:hypothetical protein
VVEAEAGGSRTTEQLVELGVVVQEEIPQTELEQLEQQILEAVVVVVPVVLLPVETEQRVAPASSSSATWAHSAAQAAPSRSRAVSPSTPSHRPALTQHKEQQCRISPKSTTASSNK